MNRSETMKAFDVFFDAFTSSQVKLFIIECNVKKVLWYDIKSGWRKGIPSLFFTTLQKGITHLIDSIRTRLKYWKARQEARQEWNDLELDGFIGDHIRRNVNKLLGTKKEKFQPPPGLRLPPKLERVEDA